MKNMFYYFGNIINLPSNGEVLLLKDVVIKRPSQEQLLIIRKYVDPIVEITNLGFNPYDVEFSKDGGRRLKDSENKHFIIECKGDNIKSEYQENLSLAFFLSKLNLCPLLKVMFKKHTNGLVSSSVTYYQLKLFNFYTDNNNLSEQGPDTFSQEDLDDYNNVWNLINNFDRIKYGLINKALVDFTKIYDVSIYSPFRILTYFSVLETVLTVNRIKEVSISNQLKSKTELLNNLFHEPINIHTYFHGADTNSLGTILGKLYEYRNNITHGNHSDFDKELRIFKGRENLIIPFLHELIRKILVFSIQSPQLILDLREC